MRKFISHPWFGVAMMSAACLVACIVLLAIGYVPLWSWGDNPHHTYVFGYIAGYGIGVTMGANVLLYQLRR